MTVWSPESKDKTLADSRLYTPGSHLKCSMTARATVGMMSRSVA
jgi:hypothetical protein